MKRFLLGSATILSIFFFFSFMQIWPYAAEDAKIIHHNALTIDSHIDLREDFNSPGNDAGQETVDQLDLPKLDRGDLDVATIALFADPDKPNPANFEIARKKVEAKLKSIQNWVSAHPDKLEFAKTSADLERIANSGKHAILLSFLNAFWFNKDLSLIEKFYKDGVRVFGFNHAGNTDFAGSSRPIAAYGDKPDVGLSDLGKQAVAKLNKLGIVVDVSQLSKPATLEVVALSKTPVIASHSAVHGRVENTRNLSNEELKAIAAKGGVVQIVAFAGYLKRDSAFSKAYLKAVAEPFGLTPLKDDPKEKLNAEQYKKYKEAYLNFSRNEWRYATLTDYLDAVDYAVRYLGINHVGLSSDFNHGGGVTGFANVGEAPNVTKELLRRGYTESEIKKLWGGNFIRVLKQVELYAKNPSTAVVTKRK